MIRFGFFRGFFLHFGEWIRSGWDWKQGGYCSMAGQKWRSPRSEDRESTKSGIYSEVKSINLTSQLSQPTPASKTEESSQISSLKYAVSIPLNTWKWVCMKILLWWWTVLVKVIQVMSVCFLIWLGGEIDEMMSRFLSQCPLWTSWTLWGTMCSGFWASMRSALSNVCHQGHTTGSRPVIYLPSLTKASLKSLPAQII